VSAFNATYMRHTFAISGRGGIFVRCGIQTHAWTLVDFEWKQIWVHI